MAKFRRRLKPSEYMGDFWTFKYIFKPGKRRARWQTGQEYQVKGLGLIVVKDITMGRPPIYTVHYELVDAARAE